MESALITLILLPLFCSGILIFTGMYLGKGLSQLVSASFAVISAVLSTMLCYNGLNNGILEFTSKPLIWLRMNELVLPFSFYQDGLSFLMGLIVSLISSCIILYSAWYMNNDSQLLKFQATLFFFSFSMLLLVTSGNLFQFFIGWECIGLASFLLISHWGNRNEAVNGGLKAIIYNRIGDGFFLLALSGIYSRYKSFDFQEIIALTKQQTVIQGENLIGSTDVFVSNINLEEIGILLILAAFVKSAMVLFHAWLFNAMEGPTPVSALLHSATMVTAGIFLLLRVSFILEENHFCVLVVTFAGVITTVFAALGAYFQIDIKRIVAYSTCSQLGLMVVGLGFGCLSQTMYHLTTHAFFKAVLFLMAGILIHSIFNHQDNRVGSETFLSLPTSETIYGSVIAALALFGFPTLSGYFSKDFLLESILDAGALLSISTFILVSVASGLTAAYSMKSLLWAYYYNDAILPIKTHSAAYTFLSSKLLLVILTLGLCSGILGYFLFSFFEKGDFYTMYLGLIYPIEIIQNHSVNIELFLLPTYISIGGCALSIWLNLGAVHFMDKNLYFKKFTCLFKRDYAINDLYNTILSWPVLWFAYKVSYRQIDRGFLELFGPKGIWLLISKIYLQPLAVLHNGSIFHYIRLTIKYAGFFLLLILFGRYLDIIQDTSISILWTFLRREELSWTLTRFSRKISGNFFQKSQIKFYASFLLQLFPRILRKIRKIAEAAYMPPKQWILLLYGYILWTNILYYVWIPRTYFYSYQRFLDYEIEWHRQAALYRRKMLEQYGKTPIKKLKIVLPNKEVIHADQWDPKKDSWLRDDKKMHKKWPAPKHPQAMENPYAPFVRWNGREPEELTKRNFQELSKATAKLTIIMLGITLLHYLYDTHGNTILKFLFESKDKVALWVYRFRKKKDSHSKKIYVDLTKVYP